MGPAGGLGADRCDRFHNKVEIRCRRFSEIRLWSPRIGLNEIPAQRVWLCHVSLQMRGIRKRESDERKDVFLLVHQFC